MMVNRQILFFFLILQPFNTHASVLNVTLQQCFIDGCDKKGTLRCEQDTLTGKRHCSCYQGFLSPLCKDLDECTIGHRVCKDNGMCINTVGSFRCVCLPGWTGPHCRQNDTSNPCPVGYEVVAGNCTDIDECTLSFVNPCGHGTCHNTEGSYRCACTSGWTGNRCFVDIDECGSKPCLNGKCTDLQNGFSCTCSAFWTGTLCDVPRTTLDLTGTSPSTLPTTTISTTNTQTSLSPKLSTGTSTVTSQSTRPSTTGADTTLRSKSNSSNVVADSDNVPLIAGCVAGGIVVIGGGTLASILLHHLLIKHRKEVDPGLQNQDTVIEVHQQACTDGPESHPKDSHGIVGIPVGDAGPGKEFFMKTRFSIKRLLRQ